MKRLWNYLCNALFGFCAFIIVKSIVDSTESDDLLPPSLVPMALICGCILGLSKGLPGRMVVEYYLHWNAFGNRLKVAYEAKFGYPNPEFNKEVDQHIKIMESMGKGYVKEIAEDWLKRMAKFVGVPFAVPAEERMSEMDKTLLYENVAG